MNPRLRLALICAGVAIVTGFMLVQVYAVTLGPLLAWRGERTDDRAAFQQIAGLKTRSEIEHTLSGWSADRVEGTRYCEMLLKRRSSDGGCKAADQEIIYLRQRTAKRTAPLTPLKIIVVYDHADRVIVTSTLD